MEPPHYIVYDVEEGMILDEDLRDVKLSDHKYALVQGQDEKWQYVDAVTFEPLSETYDAAALYQDGFGVVIQDGHLAMLDEEFHVLSTDEQTEAQGFCFEGVYRRAGDSDRQLHHRREC